MNKVYSLYFLSLLGLPSCQTTHQDLATSTADGVNKQYETAASATGLHDALTDDFSVDKTLTDDSSSKIDSSPTVIISPEPQDLEAETSPDNADQESIVGQTDNVQESTTVKGAEKSKIVVAKGKLVSLSQLVNNKLSNPTGLSAEVMVKTILSENKFVVLDFFAEWCPPCKNLTQVLGELVKDKIYADIIFLKIDVEAFSAISSTFNVRSMPTIVFVQEGNVMFTTTGSKSSSEFRGLLKNVFKVS